MTALLAENEDAPDAWPDAPAGLSTEAAAIPPETVWLRIEGWVSTRWAARSVTYLIEGPGEWTPRLSPFTATSAELWTGESWETATLHPSPLGGFMLDAEGPYRIIGTAGDGSAPPANVEEAYRRLAEYFAAARAAGGVGSTFGSMSSGDLSLSDRPSKWIAQAIHLSGASDLLRRYRRLA